jgi:UDP-glucose 4-epimerase
MLVARADRIRRDLGWQPHRNDLDTIVRDALHWERKLPTKPLAA